MNNLKNMQLVLEGESLGVKVASYAIALKDFAVQKAKLVYEKISGAIQRSNLLKGIADMAISAYSSIAKIPLIGPILGIAAAAAAATLGYSYLSKADDMISPGYGKRVLSTPEGTIALNNKDTVVAGTNLFKGDDVISAPAGAATLSDPIDYDKLAAATANQTVQASINYDSYAARSSQGGVFYGNQAKQNKML